MTQSPRSSLDLLSRALERGWHGRGSSITLSVRRRGTSPLSKGPDFRGHPSLATLNAPSGICVDGRGRVVVSDTRNACIRVASASERSKEVPLDQSSNVLCSSLSRDIAAHIGLISNSACPSPPPPPPPPLSRFSDAHAVHFPSEILQQHSA